MPISGTQQSGKDLKLASRDVETATNGQEARRFYQGLRRGGGFLSPGARAQKKNGHCDCKIRTKIVDRQLS